MAIVSIVAIILGVFVLVATAIPVFRNEQWWIRVFDFPRFQILVLGIISLVLLAISWESRWYEHVLAILVAISLIYQTIRIFPYTPLAKKEVLTCRDNNGNPVISIMVMNVFMDNKNAQRALEIISQNQPDIVIAVETNQWWNNKLSVLKSDYPYNVLVPLENTYGMTMFSKLKLSNTEVKFLYDEDVPSIHTKVLMDNGKRFKLYAVHPKPPAPGHNKTSTQRDAELVTIGKNTRHDEEPVVVAGDMNDVAWSHTTKLFQRFSELLDPRVGRGMFNTFHAGYRFFRWPLDHIFHSDHFQLLEIKRLPGFGSDHFPIFIKLCYLPQERHFQEEPKADSEDVEQANEKISRANAM